MNITRLLPAASVALPVVLCSALSYGVAELECDPFPSFASIPKNELVKPNASFQIAPDGSLTVEGEPRYFPATFWYGGFEYMHNGNTGCLDALKWLYDEMPNYETMSRLGFDATGFSCTFKWMRAYRPNQKEFPTDWKKSLPSLMSGFPLYMDFTASEWGLGSMNMGDHPIDPAFKGKRQSWEELNKKVVPKASLDIDDGDGALTLDDFDPGKKAEEANKPKPTPPGYLGPEAFTVGHNHWVAYSIVHPKGRQIWLDMWKHGLEEAVEKGLKPWCCELFNEPAVFDTSAYAEKEFAGRMAKRFGKDWKTSLSDRARAVERTKYNEERFASLLKEGSDAIHEVLPTALTTFQPCTIRTRGLDLYRCYRELGVVCSHTGGRGLMEAHMLRGLADGKPIVDNEMYIGSSTNSIRQSYLDQYQRGYNMSMSFKWSADRSGYNFMNRANVSPDALLGVRLAKRDIMDVNEFLTPRDRGVRRETAVLFSNPSERLGHGESKLFDQAVVGIDAAQLPMDVIWEEDVTNSVERLSRYKLLVIAGSDAAYPGTLAQIEKWVKGGGLLLLLNTKFALDEYGEPDSAAFTANLAEGETKLGKGYVRYVPGRMSPEQIGKHATEMGAKAGVAPCCEVLDGEAEGKKSVFPVEVHPAVRNGMYAWSVTLRTIGPKLVRFKPAKAGELMIRVWSEVIDGDVVSCRQKIVPDADGYYVMYLNPNNTRFLVSGTREQLLKRYPPAENVRWLKSTNADAARAEAKSAAEAKAARAAAGAGRFTVEPDRVMKIDLSKQANAELSKTLKISTSAKAEEGAVVWGEGRFDGVPMDILRFDQNNMKDCVLVTAAKGGKGIPVNSLAGAIYFFTAGELKGTAYLAGGKTAEFKGGKSGRKPYVWKWENPNPTDAVLKIDLMPATSEPPVALAMTLEKPPRGKIAIPGNTIVPRGINSRGVTCTVVDGVWRIELDETATSWSTTGINFTEPIPCDKGKYAKLTFEWNRLPDQWGNYHDHATPQMRINTLDRKGRMGSANWMVPKWPDGGWAYRTDNDPETWQKACFFMKDGAIVDSAKKIVSIALQFQQMPAERSGLAFRNFELELADDYVPSADAAEEEPAKPGAPAVKKRRGPKFEAPTSDGLSLDLD